MDLRAGEGVLFGRGNILFQAGNAGMAGLLFLGRGEAFLCGTEPALAEVLIAGFEFRHGQINLNFG